MFISIKSLNGNKSEINVDDDATVKQVKLILQEKGMFTTQLIWLFLASFATIWKRKRVTTHKIIENTLLPNRWNSCRTIENNLQRKTPQ